MTSKGRPPKEPNKLKSERLYIRVTPAEKAAMVDKAGKAGLSAWIRRVLLREVKR